MRKCLWGRLEVAWEEVVGIWHLCSKAVKGICEKQKQRRREGEGDGMCDWVVAWLRAVLGAWISRTLQIIPRFVLYVVMLEAGRGLHGWEGVGYASVVIRLTTISRIPSTANSDVSLPILPVPCAKMQSDVIRCQ